MGLLTNITKQIIFLIFVECESKFARGILFCNIKIKIIYLFTFIFNDYKLVVSIYMLMHCGCNIFIQGWFHLEHILDGC